MTFGDHASFEQTEELLFVGQMFFLSALILSVLSFGGMEATTRSMTEIFLFVSGLLLLASPAALKKIRSHGITPLTAPLVLLFAVSVRLLSFHGVQNGNEPSASAHCRLCSADIYATSTHVLIMVACCVSFYYGLLSGTSRRLQKQLAYTLVALGSGEAFYGLVQYLTGWQKIFLYSKKYDLLEATGTYINRNHYAGLLEIVIPFSLSLCFWEWSKLLASADRHNQIRYLVAKQGFFRGVFWAALTIVLAIGLIVSRSRMGIMSAVGSVAAMPLVRGINRKRAVCISIVLMCLFLGLVGMAGDPIGQRFADLNQEYTLSEGSRFAIWRDTVRLIAHHPWLGTGLGTFPIVYTSVQTTFLGNFVNHAHNDYLEIASDLGIPAALLIFGTIGMAGIKASRHVSKGRFTFDKAVLLGCTGSIVAILLHSLSDFNLYIPANALVFSSVLGLSCSPNDRQKLHHALNEETGAHTSKRILDVAFSIILVAILLPLFLVISAAIALNSPGPVLFTVRAAGRSGKPFDLLKFRTMTANTHSGPQTFDTWVTDPRITRVGRLLRRWSLDELPQLVNVIAGDMSLVGPRPTFEEMLPRFSHQAARRFLVKPGITGLAQIRGRNLLSWPQKIACDLEYIDTYSPFQDLKILMATFPIWLTGKGVYGIDGCVRMPEFANRADTCRDHV
jgi:lipopolysaccharide/colanic/teichoic acid biosynthesis glycosyltransferase